MKTSIEIPFNVGDRAWALINKSPLEVDVVAFTIVEDYKNGREIEYKVNKVGDKTIFHTVHHTDIYPTKESIKMKLLEYENFRHESELKRIENL